MDDFANFYVATASVTGALIGLLFVAISVSRERLTGPDASAIHRVRASAALTTLTNALILALLALVPDLALGPTAVAIGLTGVGFVIASMLLLRRERGLPLTAMAFVAISGFVLRRHRGSRARDARDAAFLFVLLAALGAQIVAGVLLTLDPDTPAGAQLLATSIVLCCFIGVERSWELIGGPSIGFTSEVRALLGDDARTAVPTADGERPSRPPAGTSASPDESARPSTEADDR